MSKRAIEHTVVSWNRDRLDLASDEVLAQVLDRGDLASLRRRILSVVQRVPLPFPAFWLAALSGLGEAIDWTLPLPQDNGPA